MIWLAAAATVALTAAGILYGRSRLRRFFEAMEDREVYITRAHEEDRD